MTPLAKTILACMHPVLGEERGYVWGFVRLDPKLIKRILRSTPTADTGSAPYIAFRRSYADDMMRGDWLFTGDTLAFSHQGVTIDGRARLQAALSLGEPLWSLAVIGVEESMRSRVDLRSVGRVKQTPHLPRDLTRGASLTISLAVGIACGKLPDPAADSEASGEAAASYEHAEGVPVSGGLTRWSVAAFHWLASAINPGLADSFVNGLVFPVIAGDTAPAIIARSHSKLSSCSRTQAMALLCVGWDSYLSGKPFDMQTALAVSRRPDPIITRIGEARARQPTSTTSVVRGTLPPGVTVGYERIDARAAQALLDTIPRGTVHSRKIESDLRNSLWANDTGQTVKIAPDGTLLDGRKRLRAVVRTGIAIHVLVVRGVPPAAASKMNVGRRGGLGFALQSRSKTNPHDHPAIIANLIRYDRGNDIYAPTQAEIAAAAAHWPFVRGAAEITKPCKDFLMQSVAGACAVIFAAEDIKATRQIFRQLVRYREGGFADEPIARFFEHVIDRKGIQTIGERMHQMRMLLSVWQSWRDQTNPYGRRRVKRKEPWIAKKRHGVPAPAEAKAPEGRTVRGGGPSAGLQAEAH